MYAIRALPTARSDAREIVAYVANTLGNPQAAARLSEKLFEGMESLAELPYRRPVYVPLKPLKHEYRTLRVDRYLIFYWVDEAAHEVIIARILYERADISRRFASGVD